MHDFSKKRSCVVSFRRSFAHSFPFYFLTTLLRGVCATKHSLASNLFLWKLKNNIVKMGNFNFYIFSQNILSMDTKKT